ncbi:MULTISPECIES: purine-nucleoside phosphorylase [unclassified Enterococcus]|uniref:purine-nucleoside phosphorylase n=1 Tax=unclassified Enterococcus TaxID=2608891 RepID=UPI001551D972|nr:MULTISPECIES: purine-nucleoside phosphorylase [unclassified Enterococcus]MBS7576990.1 purine-nucleoside phosphorylase [Enterococcus sp. MMGLQ5-2]MBS7584563.1 purine-nucleoside phosphorylase [Enterococcus sp. MMGLQ5-1]NPD12418.1 purine-nucleoside phosphorylase [Enterococcus sp. MMGLQ5-1]NPD36824.1 purine-nucleoside phosphorylase [Enterococcus sp. MMGLQ5-2]
MTEINQILIEETVSYLKAQGVGSVEFGLILGSGLGDLVTEIENVREIPYQEIPGFPASTVVGHAGQLVYGTLSGKTVLAMQGRFHYYEGHSMQVVTYPVRIMKALGATGLIVTNAAGGVNINFEAGDLMAITDHINFMGNNPLIGDNLEAFGPRFPDMSQAYDRQYLQLLAKVAKDLKIRLQSGIYMGFSGPSYETPAEIHLARTVGGDAVGMSTVPEVIVANHSGIRVLGISAITNKAAGMQTELNHDEVVAVTNQLKTRFKALVKQFLAEA